MEMKEKRRRGKAWGTQAPGKGAAWRPISRQRVIDSEMRGGKKISDVPAYSTCSKVRNRERDRARQGETAREKEREREREREREKERKEKRKRENRKDQQRDREGTELN